MQKDRKVPTNYYIFNLEETTNPTVVLAKIYNNIAGKPITSKEYKEFFERLGVIPPTNLTTPITISLGNYRIEPLGYEPPAELFFKARIKNADETSTIELQEAIDLIVCLKEKYGI